MALSDFWNSIFGNAEQKSGSGEEEREPAESSPPASETSKGRRYLTIGLDWGTSTTKVVIRDRYGPGSPAYLVDFGRRGSETNSYLLPSALSVAENDQVRLGKGKGKRTIPELKVHLIEQTQESLSDSLDAQPRELAALYIAKVLRYARRWLKRNYGDRYQGYQLVWEFNLGIPASSHDDEKIRTLFESLAEVGWELSTQSDNEVQDAREIYRALDKGEFEAGIPEDFVNVIPEIAAQVAGYARSSLRRPGLHVLVDIGASTLDLGGFILTEQEGEDRFSILEAGVYSMGAFQLERNRLPRLKKVGRDYINSQEHPQWANDMARRCHDPIRKVPSEVRKYFPEDIRGDIQWSDIKHIDESFKMDCYKTIRALIADLRNNRAPKGKRWREGLPIFLAGGGKDVAVYREALRKVDHWREKRLSVAPFDIRDLPSLEDLTASDLASNQEHRFSVAYGLSYPADDIGEIKRPGEIPDIEFDTDRNSLNTTDYRDTKAYT